MTATTMVRTGGGPDDPTSMTVPERRELHRPTTTKRNVVGKAVPVRIMVERDGAAEPSTVMFDPSFVFALSDSNKRVTVAAIEDIEWSGSHVTFNWWCVPTELTVDHERSFCRFLSERLVEQWRE